MISLRQVVWIATFPNIFIACNLAVWSQAQTSSQARGPPTAMVRYLRGSAVLLLSSILTCFVGIQKDDRWLPCPWSICIHLHQLLLCIFNSCTPLLSECGSNCTCHLSEESLHMPRRNILRCSTIRDTWWFCVKKHVMFCEYPWVEGYSQPLCIYEPWFCLDILRCHCL